MAGNVPSWQKLGPRFSNGSLHENLRAARQISCAAFLPRKIVKHSQKRTQHMYGGDCDAAIAKAAAAVTHVQSQSQEVGSGDEGLGLLCFDLSSAETDFWWLEDEQSRLRKISILPKIFPTRFRFTFYE